ncbi:winged helix-turn-helix transcriptional regulator [Chitinophaga flava]|uniref:Transcriptional regulator n=1 Tax=Chitinophaga flava TaxID=2259036 RepID=A0A365XW82_9BACT|nr:helix-turn-helix domain-containing protein [Chitinophaga flava]RBL90338.1 transcriptional regulator [Chitinophaga flava]
MYERKIPENLECGVNITAKVLGGKWKACILHGIGLGTRRPADLHRAIPEAPARVVNLHLRELEEYGIICKKIYPGFPLKVEYFLTALGESILPIVEAMDRWGNENRAAINLVSPAPMEANQDLMPEMR